MAACGSLQHIFENPLPESPTLLETLSSWNQILPTDHQSSASSFTEIFGELHFKESFSSTSLTESNPDTPDPNPWKEPFSNGESSSFHMRSTSLSSSNYTEGRLDDVEKLKEGGMGGQESQKEGEKEQEETLKKQIQHPNLKPVMIRRTKSANTEDFPPPISCMGKSGKPWVGFKSYRYGGRFILKEIRVPTHEFLHASRENGRLKLHILVPKEETVGAKEEEHRNANENNQENSTGKP